MMKKMKIALVLIVMALIAGCDMAMPWDPIEYVLTKKATLKKLAKARQEREVNYLSKDLTGYIIDEGFIIDLKNKKHSKLPLIMEDKHWLLDISNINKSNKVAYLTIYYNSPSNSSSEIDCQSELRICDLDGTDNTVITKVSTVKRGYHDEIERNCGGTPLGNITISPDGKFLALINRIEKNTSLASNPQAVTLYCDRQGRLEIYELATMKKIREFFPAFNEGIGWLPDSKALVFVTPGETTRNMRIKKINIQTGKTLDLVTGNQPVVSQDGSLIMAYMDSLSGAGSMIRFLDLKTMNKITEWRSPELQIKGGEYQFYDVVAVLDSRKVLYRGPSTGHRLNLFTYGPGYSKRIPCAESLKVTDIKQGTFQTITMFCNDD